MVVDLQMIFGLFYSSQKQGVFVIKVKPPLQPVSTHYKEQIVGDKMGNTYEW